MSYVGRRSVIRVQKLSTCYRMTNQVSLKSPMLHGGEGRHAVNNLSRCLLVMLFSRVMNVDDEVDARPLNPYFPL